MSSEQSNVSSDSSDHDSTPLQEDTTTGSSENKTTYEGRVSKWLVNLEYLLTDDKGKRVGISLLVFLGIITLISGIAIIQAFKFVRSQKIADKTLKLVRAPQIEMATKFGTVIIKSEDAQNAFFLLSPVGENEETPWVRTGIEIEEGDRVRITASGRVNTAMKRIVAQTLRPEIDEQSWADPTGLPSSTNGIIPVINEAKLLPDQNNATYRFGMLLAAVRDEVKEQIKPEDIIPFNQGDKVIEFNSTTTGELVLAVNDIWLSKDKKDVYVPSWTDDNEGDNFEYYLQAAEFDAALRDEDFGRWSEERKREEAKKQYQKRLEDWNDIVKNNNWNIWYEDNIGAFSVSINVKPGKVDESETK